MAAIYRGLRDNEPADEAGLRRLLEGDEALPRAAELAGRAVAALSELGLVEVEQCEQGRCARRLRVVSSEKTDAELSASFRRSQALYEVRTRFLNSQRQA
jgi:hypothetical protein